MKDDHQVVLDLLYGAPSWTIMLRHWRAGTTMRSRVENEDSTFDPLAPLGEREIMYIHTGGLEGINSQLLRYKYKGLIETEDVQLPGRKR